MTRSLPILDNVPWAALVFRLHQDEDAVIVVMRQTGDESGNVPALDCLEFHRRFGWNARTAIAANMDDCDGEFFLVYVADCWSPPLAIVRGEYMSDSHDIGKIVDLFAKEFDWAKIDEKDYPPDGEDDTRIQVNAHGDFYDTTDIVVRQVELVRVECVW